MKIMLKKFNNLSSKTISNLNSSCSNNRKNLKKTTKISNKIKKIKKIPMKINLKKLIIYKIQIIMILNIIIVVKQKTNRTKNK